MKNRGQVRMSFGREWRLAAATVAAVGMAIAPLAAEARANHAAAGGRILFNSGGNGVPSRWFLIRPSGADRRVLPDDLGWVRLSQDGTRIAFGCREGLCVSSSDGSQRRVIASSTGRDPLGFWPGSIAWSPDGHRLAFSSRQGISTIAPDGSARRLLVGVSRPFAIGLAWSPTGSMIAFTRSLSDTGPLGQYIPGTVCVVRAQGAPRLRRLARIGFAFGGLSWSPNGRLLAWVRSRGGAPGKIFVTDLVAGKSRRLAIGGDPSFSPDGRMLAFDRLVRGNVNVAVMRSDGTHERTFGFGLLPVWSPSGRQIAFVADGLKVMNADGTRKRLVARAPGDVGRLGPLQWTKG